MATQVTSRWTSPSQHLIQKGELIKQGAEGRVYTLQSLIPEPSVYWPPSGPSNTGDSSSSASPTPQPVILKHRFPKQYRHPTLDRQLTRTRLSFEARALARCTRAGVVVPRVLWVDPVEGVLGMEKIEGWSVRDVLGGGAGGEDGAAVEEEEPEEEWDEKEGQATAQEAASQGAGLHEEPDSEGMKALKQVGVTREHLMSSIGTVLAKLHSTTIIHGDLTTSNMMVRLKPQTASPAIPTEAPYEIVLIDFGLSSTAQFAEHYAVDLYVLERAFASTHPASEGLYAGVLEAYAKGLGEKKWAPVEQKLKDGECDRSPKAAGTQR